MRFVYFVVGMTAGALIAAGAWFAYRTARRKMLAASFETALFLVKIPRAAKPGEADSFKSEIAKFEQLLSALASFKKHFTFEVAVPHVGEEIHFYLAVPKRTAAAAVRQVQSIWTGASVEEAGDDYNIFNPQGAVAGAYLLQKENSALPIRTYEELGADSFGGILGAFAKVDELGEGIALQVAVRPAGVRSKKNIERHIDELKKGGELGKVLKVGLGLRDVAEAFKTEGAPDPHAGPKTVDEEGVKSLTAKIQKPLFETNVRLIASANSPFQAGNLLDGLIAGFQQFAAPRRNEFKIVKVRNPQKISSEFIFRQFNSDEAMLLSGEEIASFYHFPIPQTDTPKVKWLKSKEAPPPSNLPAAGTLVGYSVYRSEERPVYLTDEDRRRHVYAVGQTGTGKTTLISSMLLEDIRNGKGVAVIDPHGEFAQNVLKHIPKERLDDLIYFDPGDIWKPLGLNMLDFNPSRPEEKTFIVNEMQSIFNKLFTAETMGPMFEQYMRNALLLLMEDMANEPATLIEVPRIFTDAEFRKRKLGRIHNPVVIDFWEKEAVKAGGEASLANMTPYITSKFNNFISNDYLRPIIGQPKSALNFREAMDSGKIMIVNLSKGRIGDINANLLGMIVVGKILMAALSRVDLPQDKRRDFSLYIDEFQNFTTDSIASILSEARKYGLNLVVAHQFIAQLTDHIRDAVFGNVGSMFIMRVGSQDAEFLVKQVAPQFDENDLVNLDNLRMVAKILVNGTTTAPFSMKASTASWEKGDPELAEKMKEYSREKYGRDRQIVEDDIYKRLRDSAPAAPDAAANALAP